MFQLRTISLHRKYHGPPCCPTSVSLDHSLVRSTHPEPEKTNASFTRLHLAHRLSQRVSDKHNGHDPNELSHSELSCVSDARIPHPVRDTFSKSTALSPSPRKIAASHSSARPAPCETSSALLRRSGRVSSEVVLRYCVYVPTS
jgi:hypothetical protein